MDELYISKTEFKDWQLCPRYAWNLKRKKISKALSAFDLDLSSQGNEVEEIAMQLFPNVATVEGDSREERLAETLRLSKDKTITTLYQAASQSDRNTSNTPKSGFYAKADFLTLDHDNQTLDLYEVKAITNPHLELLSRKNKTGTNLNKNGLALVEDIGFQKLAFASHPYKVASTYIISLNPKCVRRGTKPTANKLLKIENVSYLVDTLLPSRIIQKAHAACRDYLSDEEPLCDCSRKTKDERCPQFERFNPQMPSRHSILTIKNISQKKSLLLLDKNLTSIHDLNQDILDKAEFSRQQVLQIKAVQKGEPIIEHHLISHALESLHQPLYFLDYETVSYAIPIFDRATPYQQIIFQFSLHILRDGHLTHHAYLMQDNHQSEHIKLIEKLKECIGDQGSVVVWHQSAEHSFQKNLSQLFPQYQQFFENLNNRLFDLKKVVAEGVIHPDFGGSTSLKAVTPVLVEDLSYQKLHGVQDGQTAAASWKQALTDTPSGREATFSNLLEYCRYDTLTMVKIYQYLQKIVGHDRVARSARKDEI